MLHNETTSGRRELDLSVNQSVESLLKLRLTHWKQNLKNSSSETSCFGVWPIYEEVQFFPSVIHNYLNDLYLLLYQAILKPDKNKQAACIRKYLFLKDESLEQLWWLFLGANLTINIWN